MNKQPQNQNSTNISRRGVLKGGAAGGATALGLGIWNWGTSEDFLPDIPRQEFTRTIDTEMDEFREKEDTIEDIEDELNETLSFEPEDYDPSPRAEGEYGFQPVDSVILADTDNHVLTSEQAGDDFDFTFPTPTEGAMNIDIGEYVEQINNEIGLTGSERERVENDELIQTFNNVSPFIRNDIITDQPQTEQAAEEFEEWAGELDELGRSYMDTLDNIVGTYRELEEMLGRLKNANRESKKRKIRIPHIWDNFRNYDQEEHFTDNEADDYADEIRGYRDEVGELLRDVTHKAAVTKGAMDMAEHLSEEIDALPEIYEGGDFDADGNPRNGAGNGDSGEEWIEYDELSYCDQDRARELYDDPEELEFRPTGDNHYNVRGPEVDGQFQGCVDG